MLQSKVVCTRPESAIGLDTAQNGVFASYETQFLSAGRPVAAQCPAAGNGIFGCRDKSPKSTRETANVHRDRKAAPRTANIPAETAYFQSTTVSAVWEDWMVETEGIELATPHAVVEPVSGTRVRNGIFQCRDGRVKAAFSSRRDRYGDEGIFEKPAFRGTNARISGGVRYLWTGWWAHQGSNLGPDD